MPGKVVAVYGPVVDVLFDEQGQLPKISEVLTASNCDGQAIVFEVVEYLGLNSVRCICFQPTYGLMRQAIVERTNNPICVNKAELLTGRVLNVLGEPIDKKDKLPQRGAIPIKEQGLRRQATLEMTGLLSADQ